MIITLKNDKLGTEARVRVDDLPLTLTPEQTRRAYDALGGAISGPQVGPDGRKLIVEVAEDGTITIPGRKYMCRWCRVEGQAARSDKKWCSGQCRLQARRYYEQVGSNELKINT